MRCKSIKYKYKVELFLLVVERLNVSHLVYKSENTVHSSWFILITLNLRA